MSTDTPSPTKALWWYLLTLFVVPWLIYSPAVPGDFVYDDIAITVVENPFLRGEVSWLEVLTWERPVREFTYLLDYTLWGTNPVGYHLQNIAWHCANGLLLFWLCLRLRCRGEVAFAISILFVVHPIQAESVAWISGRKELLCLFFQLGAIHCVLTSLQTGRSAWMLAACASFVLALLSKQVAVVLPVVIALLWLSTNASSLHETWKPWLWRCGVLLLVCVAYILLHSGLGDRLRSVSADPVFFDPGASAVEASVLSWALTPFAAFDALLVLLVSPLDLVVERAFLPVQSLADFRWVMGAALLLLGTAVAVSLRKIFPVAALGWGWMLLAWLPLSGIVPLAYIMADRYLYIPSVGFCMALVVLCNGLLRDHARGVLSFSLALAVVFSVLTIDRCFDWRTEVSLWEAAASSRPANPKVFSALGNAYQRQGREAESFQAWQRSLALDADQPNVWLNLGLAERQRGDLDAAERAYRKALDLLPGYGTAMYNLAFVYEMRGDAETARTLFVQAAGTLSGEVNQQRRRGMAHYQAARLFAQASDWDAARVHLAQAEQFAPRYAPVFVLIGQLPGTAPPRARLAFEHALLLDPESAEAWYNLGVLEWRTGNRTRAEECWSRAIALRPTLQSNIDRIRSQNN